MSEVVKKLDMTTKTDQQLVRDMLANIKRAVVGLKRAAVYAKELDKRGYDFSQGEIPVPDSTLGVLRKIYQGKMLPEFFLDWRDSPIWRQIKNQPLTIQRKIIENKPFEGVTDREGKLETVLIPPVGMSSTQARVIFDEGRVRNPREQIAIVQGMKLDHAITKEKTRPIPYEYDRKTRTLHIYEPCKIKDAQLRSMLGE